MTPSGCYLLVYDVSSNKLRTKVAKTVEGYGMRVQKSVFECRLSRGMKARLWQRLMEIPLETEDRISMYSLGRSGGRKIGRKPQEDLSNERHAMVF